jgi:RNA polymerase sigma factor (sigma-70 family)
MELNEYAETDTETIRLTHQLQQANKELESLIKEEWMRELKPPDKDFFRACTLDSLIKLHGFPKCIDRSSGRYCGPNNKVKALEIIIDQKYQKLLFKYKKMVHHWVKKFPIPPIVGYEDIVSVGEAALYKGFKRYDPMLSKATTFVSRTILGEIKKYFRDYCWPLKVSRKLKDAVSGHDNRDRDAKELSEKYGMDENEIQKVQNVLKVHIAYEEYRNNELDSDIEPYDELLLEEMLNRLSEVEEEVVRLRYLDHRSMIDIADLCLLESAQAKRIMDGAIEKLKTMYAESEYGSKR